MGADSNVRSKRSRATPSSVDATNQRSFGGPPRDSASARLRDVGELGATVDALVGQGDALMFSRTSDGGAIVLTLLRENRREKFYAVKQVDLEQAFDWLREEYMGG